MQRKEPRILIADDDAAIRGLLRVIAARKGLAVDEASNGSECLSRLSKGTYEAVILDLSMPEVNGYDVIERLRTERRRPAVIVVTALPRSASTELDPDVVTCIIRKPFDVDVLASILTKIAAHVQSQRVMRGRRRSDALPAKVVEPNGIEPSTS